MTSAGNKRGMRLRTRTLTADHRGLPISGDLACHLPAADGGKEVHLGVLG